MSFIFKLGTAPSVEHGQLSAVGAVCWYGVGCKCRAPRNVGITPHLQYPGGTNCFLT